MTFSRDWSSDVCSSDLHDGEPVYPPTALMQMPGGNLAFGENHLAVATAEHLHVLRFDPGLEPPRRPPKPPRGRSEEHTSELQSRENLVCRLLLEKKKRQ